MFSHDQEEYLIRALGRNQVVLFLGAGFSSEAKNKINNKIPSGRNLSEIIWRFMGYPGDYDNTSLAEMYEAMMKSGKTHASIRNLLEENLLCKSMPEKYNSLCIPYWHRIFTTNIDDLLEEIYKRIGNIQTEILAYPSDDIGERDQFLDKIQLVYLNGRLPCQPNEVTFSYTQYASAATKIQPLYDEFVRNYSSHPTIFIGTQLNEPIFWQYVELRGERFPKSSEYRPKSFLICPSISPVKIDQLSKYNIEPIVGTTLDFMDWIKKISPKLPSKIDIIKAISPNIIEVLETIKPEKRFLDNVKLFSETFVKVPMSRPVSKDRSLYLLGASPRWEDILQKQDAPRTITDDIQKYIKEKITEENKIHVIAILGSAGCGKSTVLRRLGINIASVGRSVYLTNSEYLPTSNVISSTITYIDDKILLLFDNSEIILNQLPNIISELSKIEKPPLIIFAARTNDFDRIWSRLRDPLEIKEFHIPNLDDIEINNIIKVLEENGLLGELRGLTAKQRIDVFKAKANKQILVAMREATSGKGFDEIIEDEFIKLVPEETKILYLCTALATESGYRITKEEFIACSHLPSSEAINILNRNLRDIVLSLGPSNEWLLLRHRLIAEHVIDKSAPRPLLREAYARILRVMASKIYNKNWRSRDFRLYRYLINHKMIYKRFHNDIDEARSIYSVLVSYLGNNSHFWLQYASLELEGIGGNLEFAENYILQAESLDEKDIYIRNTKGNLFLKKAIEAGSYEMAIKHRDIGSQILEEQIHRSMYQDEYAIHIYCSHRYNWARKWLIDLPEEQKIEFEKLKKDITKACDANPRLHRLRELRENIERAYLLSAVPSSIRPELPEI